MLNILQNNFSREIEMFFLTSPTLMLFFFFSPLHVEEEVME